MKSNAEVAPDEREEGRSAPGGQEQADHVEGVPALSAILAAINNLELEDARAVGRAIKLRVSQLEIQAWDNAVAAAWKRAQHWKVNDTLYVCAEGTFIGGPLQRGDKIIITFIQPRKRCLWAKKPGGKDHQFSFPAEQIERYKLSPNRPANPLPKEERDRVNAMAARIAEANL